MKNIDLIIISLYLFFIAVVGFRAGKKQNSEESYYLNNRKTNFFLILFSIVSTNVGAATCLGIASAAYSTGVSYGINIAILVFLGFIFLSYFAPRIKQIADDNNLTTMSSIFNVQYKSPKCQKLSAIIICGAYLFFIAAQFTGAAFLLSTWSGLRMELCMAFGGLTLVLYTSFSGMKGDIFTDLAHFIIMAIILLFVLPFVLFRNVVSFSQIVALPNHFYDPFAFAGQSFFFGSIVFGMPLMFASMEIWQRIYSLSDTSGNKKYSKQLFVAAAIINVPFILLPVLFGLAAKVLQPGLSPNESPLLVIVAKYVPPGLKGLVIASLAAALLSTVNSMIMVVSATITKDILHPNKTKEPKILYLRLITGGIGFVGILVAIFFKNIIDLIIGGSQIISVLAIPLIGGLYLSKPKEPAAFWSIIAGLVSTLLSMALIGVRLAFIPGLIIGALVFVVLQFAVLNKKALAR